MKKSQQLMLTSVASLVIGILAGYHAGNVSGKLDGHLAAAGGLRVLGGLHMQHQGDKVAGAIQRLLIEEADVLHTLSADFLGGILIRIHFDEKTETDIGQFVEKHRTK